MKRIRRYLNFLLDKIFLQAVIRNRKTLDEIVNDNFLYQYRTYSNPERLFISPKAHVSNALFNCASGKIEIEDYVFFGQNVYIIAATHNYNLRSQQRIDSIPSNGYDVIVKTGAWIGSNVIVIGPCVIGENSVIAAGSVVTRDIESNYLYAGNPARKVKAVNFENE